MASTYRKAGVDFDAIFAPTHPGWAQAPATKLKVAGADMSTRYALLSAGSAAANTGYKSAGADLATKFAAIGTTGVIVATQPGNVAGVAAAGNPSGTVTSNTATCAGAKGGGAYTYTWHFNGVPPAGVVFTAPNSPTTAVTAPDVPAATTWNGTMYCTISDGVTSINTGFSNWSLQNTTPSQVTTNFNGVGGSYNNGVGLYQGFDNGYDGTAFGSINSAALTGGSSIYAIYTYSPSGGTNYIQIGGFAADPGVGFLQSITVNGRAFSGATAGYSYAGGVATWRWSIATYGTFNLASGQAYTGSITYNP